MTWYGIHVRYNVYVITCLFNTFAFIHIVRLTMRHHLFLKFWLVDICFFADWRHHRAVTRLESVRQSNIRRSKKLGVQLSYKHLLFIDSSTIVPAWTPQLNQLTAIIAFEGHFKNLNLSLPLSLPLSLSFSLSLSLSPTFNKKNEKILTLQPSTRRGQLCFRDSKVTLLHRYIVSPAKNSGFVTSVIWVNVKISYYFWIWEVLWNGCRYWNGTVWAGLWSQNYDGSRGLFKKKTNEVVY